MMSTISPNELNHTLYVVGSGSKIFKALAWDMPFIPISGRTEELKAMPAFSSGSTVLIFADPPTLDGALAMLTSVVGSALASAGVHIIFISSVSALFGASNLFPATGDYSRRKRTMESFLAASKPPAEVSIVRFGNVFECGGWRGIVDKSRAVWLPCGLDRCAATELQAIRSTLVEITEHRTSGEFNLWKEMPVDTYFAHTRHVPGLLTLYRNPLGRVGIKLAAKLLRAFRIYLPSPDDINSFNPSCLTKLTA